MKRIISGKVILISGIIVATNGILSINADAIVPIHRITNADTGSFSIGRDARRLQVNIISD